MSLIGEIGFAKITIMLPENWKSDRDSIQIENLRPGQKHSVSFKVVPGSSLRQGSIIVEAHMATPKKALIQKVKTDFPEDSNAMTASILKWPGQIKSYSEIAFAITPEESFYPLSENMWTKYDNGLKPDNFSHGPVYYENSVISEFQAQTDLEMYEKLEKLLSTDPTMEEKLIKSGLNLNKKKADQLSAMYVLATKAFQGKNFQQALDFIDRLQTELKDGESGFHKSLSIAAGNLKGIVFWEKGQKRLSREAFKQTFYSNRKHPLQRYVLRNLGLLLLSTQEKSSAAQMFRLALEMKPSYTLLNSEYEKVK